MSARSGSAASSRSTSFSLPNDARNAIRADRRSPGEEVECDDEMDEESGFIHYMSNYLFLFLLNLTMRLASAKHAEFVRARGRHYSNEAEAMKVSVAGFN